jgi:hypothetical protein
MAICSDSSSVPCDLRYGDPLSPLLFAIVMETLSKMLSATVNGGFLSGFSVVFRNYDALNISHLLFVDDTLIFCGTNLDHLHYLCALFLCFEDVSGLKLIWLSWNCFLWKCILSCVLRGVLRFLFIYTTLLLD